MHIDWPAGAGVRPKVLTGAAVNSCRLSEVIAATRDHVIQYDHASLSLGIPGILEPQ